MGVWKKHLNIVEARKLSTLFCKDFNISPCMIYYVDAFHNNKYYGMYFESPPTILMLKRLPNPIGILIHELTHHLEGEAYPIRKSSTHGRNYQLAKQKVINWCNKKISSNPDWRKPLQAFQDEMEMKNFRL